MRVLVVRNDRIGDLILSTPVISTIRANYSDAFIGMFVSEYAKEVVTGNRDLNVVISDENITKNFSIKLFFSLVNKIKREKFDTALILFPSFWVCAMIFLSGIKRRISHGSKWYVFLFCNEILIQRRSRVEKHEADYNLDLARVLGGIKKIIRKTKVSYRDESVTKIKKLLEEYKIKECFGIMHCGSGGSARNWSALKYAQLADMIIEKLRFNLVFTGTAKDYRMIGEVKGLMKNKPVEILNCNGLSDLAALISLSKLFVGPSTGPLHIAVSLNIPALGIFSPVLVQSKKRWGPYCSERAIVLSPDVRCPARYRCLFERCKYYDCMEMISPEEALYNIKKLSGLT